MAKELDVIINEKSYPSSPATNSNAIKPVAGIKCPYRIIYYPRTIWDGKYYPINLSDSTKIETEFQDCLGKECACWTPIGCNRK